MNPPPKYPLLSDDTINIVICEDHILYRQGIKYTLDQKNNIQIIGEADNGVSLLNLLKHVTPNIIILDINMPVMDGVAVLPEIKRLYPAIKVLVLTMNNTPEMIEIMMSKGADGYLTKNDDPEVIYTAILDCHKEGKYIDKRTQDVLINTVRRVGGDPIIDIPNKTTQPARFDTPIPDKEPWYKMPTRATLVGLGIAFAVFIGLYAYEKLRVSNKPVKTVQAPPSYPQDYNNNRYGLDTIFSK